MQLDPLIVKKASEWLNGPYDADTKKEVQRMLDEDPKGLIDAFYTDLDFGTGGLRGIMGVGTNRVNKYTFGLATQGLAQYLLQSVHEPIRVVISHDSRLRSREFALQTADIFSANGIQAFLFEDLRPTPLLSFAIRHLNCHSGVMITASHNPKEYNGYKVYWADGGQLVPPHDNNVIAEVRKTRPEDVKYTSNPALIKVLGNEVDEAYLDMVGSLSLSSAGKDSLKTVFTSIHGTGITLMQRAMERVGFKHFSVVEAQAAPDGNFPTVHSPNPEEAAALEMAVNQANEEGADLVIGTDPDADRVGIAVRDEKGNMVLLNGNQTASVLIYYMLEEWKKAGKLDGKQFIAETIVTTDLLAQMANDYGVECPICLTGFKWIAELIRERESKLQFIAGGEESYGYLIGDAVRDKDAVASAVMIAEVAAWAQAKGSSFYNELQKLYLKYGLYHETLKSITMQGKSGADEIQAMMKNLRDNPPIALGGDKVVRIFDYKTQSVMNVLSGEKNPIDLPSSNVLQFITESGSKITARPSGTEPKIKFYFGLKSKVSSLEAIDSKKAELQSNIDLILKDLGL
jgi:phosphoglucomutase